MSIACRKHQEVQITSILETQYIYMYSSHMILVGTFSDWNLCMDFPRRFEKHGKDEKKMTRNILQRILF